MRQQIKERQSRLAKLTADRNAEIAKIRAARSSHIAKLDPPEDKLERLLERTIAQERAHIYKVVDPAKAAKIKATFQPQIDDVSQQIKTRALSISVQDKRKKKEMASVRAVFKDRLAKLNPAEEDRLESELERLREGERFELENPTPGASKEDIRAAYRPKIDDVQERLRTKADAIASLKREENQQLAAIEAQIRAEIAADGVESKLEARLAQLRSEEKAALHALLDSAAVKGVIAKYQPEIDSLRKRIRSKEAALGRINAETQALVAKVETDYRGMIAKLNTAEDKLEHKLVRAEERERQEIMKLIGPEKLKAIRAKYEPLITQRLRELHAKQRQLVGIGQKASADAMGTMNFFNGRIAGLQRRIAELSTQPPRK